MQNKQNINLDSNDCLNLGNENLDTLRAKFSD
jgi:hypothetical protein